MASILRQIVAGPRAKHQETGLDLCYVTDFLIATSGPSQTYPQRAYRNPLDQLVSYLDKKHGENWAIWEFRAEGTGYPDEAVHNRIRHYPWPDHHPPPFRLIPMIMASMRNWLSGEDLFGQHGKEGSARSQEVMDKVKDERVVVVHCKAGKGRSGSMACSYLISQCGWKPEDALTRFTEKRMRPQFGAGVSIPSQLRWISYVDRWTKGGKKYVDQEVEVLEVHVWGLRHGVKVVVEGFVDDGRKIKAMHTFQKHERQIIEGEAPGGAGFMDLVGDAFNPADDEKEPDHKPSYSDITAGSDGAADLDSPRDDTSRTRKTIDPADYKKPKPSTEGSKSSTPVPMIVRKATTFAADSEPGGRAVIFKPSEPIRLSTSDINITLERRNRAPSSMGLTMVTAVAHVWINTFFEGRGPEQDGKADESGVFHIDWDKMDGIKGSSRKGTKAADRISVLWRTVAADPKVAGVEITEPSPGSPVPQMPAANWQGNNHEDPEAVKNLGLRPEDPASANVSKANSVKSVTTGDAKEEAAPEKDVDADSLQGVKTSGPGGEAEISHHD